MSFTLEKTISFKHCDMAGIVFFPRYFEMINDTNEAFFDQALNFSFIELHKDGAIPTAEISTQFKSPGRLADIIQIKLDCTHIGRSSLGLEYNATCNGQVRFTARATIVRIDLKGKSMPWPDRVRKKLMQHLI